MVAYLAHIGAFPVEEFLTPLASIAWGTGALVALGSVLARLRRNAA
ncbi:MAG TPA: hypothetical protein VGF18_09500 [Candidatus Tumulicola sp.]